MANPFDFSTWNGVEYFQLSVPYQYVSLILPICIFIPSIIFNSLAAHRLYRQGLTSTNIVYLCLLSADITHASIQIFQFSRALAHDGWYGTKVVCQALYVPMLMSGYATCYSVLTIAFTRLRSVIGRPLNPRQALYACITVWVVAFLSTVFPFITGPADEVSGMAGALYGCNPNFFGQTPTAGFAKALAVICVLGSFAGIVLFYSLIYRTFVRFANVKVEIKGELQQPVAQKTTTMSSDKSAMSESEVPEVTKKDDQVQMRFEEMEKRLVMQSSMVVGTFFVAYMPFAAILILSYTTLPFPMWIDTINMLSIPINILCDGLILLYFSRSQKE